VGGEGERGEECRGGEGRRYHGLRDGALCQHERGGGAATLGTALKEELGSGGERSQAAGAEAAGARSVQAATTQGLQEKRGAGGRGLFMSAAAVVVATAAVVDVSVRRLGI
jgi:hypothetical protein